MNLDYNIVESKVLDRGVGVGYINGINVNIKRYTDVLNLRVYFIPRYAILVRYKRIVRVDYLILLL
jgi:hypothetical protein